MDSPETRVVIVDDEAEIRDLLSEYLSDEGYTVRTAADGAALWAILSDDIPDIVLLDLKLPGEDGLQLAFELRQRFPSTGIVMVSGKDELVDRVAGLEVGADDYIAKPFHLREVLARVRSVLRRREQAPIGVSKHVSPVAGVEPAADTDGRKLYRFAGWTLDEERRMLASEDGRPVNLTGGEFDLLLALACSPNRALSRDQLVERVSGGEAEAFDRSIDVQIGRLRRKIERNPRRPALVKTVRNIGYMLDAEVVASRE